jgi:hypothetical protein
MPVDDDRVDQIVAAATNIYDDAELAVIRYITARLARGLDAADWQKTRLAELGPLKSGLRAIAARLDGEGTAAAREAVAAGWRAGTGTAIQALGGTIAIPQKYPRAVEALADALVGELRPLHSQLLPQAVSAYRNAIGAATGRKLTGVASTRRAAQAAWAALVDDGIIGFTDKSGRRWQLSSYVEMATRTAVARAIDVGVIDAQQSLGYPFVYVTDRPQECPLCRRWEHQVLSIVHPVRKPAIATVGDARRAGLGHPNCRHQLAPWIPGMTLAPGKADPAGDAARQHQRYLERGIRKWRERETAALTPEAKRDATAKVTAWTGELTAHLRRTGLPRRAHREHPGAGYAARPSRRQDTARHPKGDRS